MKENKITVTIEKPISKVFEFTTNPSNTHLWIPQINEETSNEYPPKIGTIYRNRGTLDNWDEYKVIEFEENNIFTLTTLDNTYYVRYTYKDIGNNQTEMEYFEWVKEGDLENPFTQEILNNLKIVMEKGNK